ncbi:hypothetical protein GCM10025865_05900 [Paraoerskovia sediminicola]|uniref:Uncharacterized protein n=1 Tax=Paraoerskovia sediminicola TaxID=1138587 RepID=A0ABN6X940_9CELL|nr:hypothetical protein GCM10025865_05900 [Paraoerskovia sediminicola]
MRHGVLGEQGGRREAARVRQLGERGRERHACGDPDGGLDRRRHDDGKPDLLGQVEARLHPAERLHLEDDDVGGLRADHGERVLGPADRLVGGDGHVDGPAHRRELRDVGARLLDVLEPSGGAVQHADPGDRLVRRPGAVGIDPDEPARTERGPDRLEPGDLRADRLVRPVGEALRDLDLRRPAPVGGHDDLVGAVRIDGGDGDVHGDGVTARGGPAHVGRLAGRSPPGEGLGVVVLAERRELAPARSPADEDALPRVDATKPQAQGCAVDDEPARCGPRGFWRHLASLVPRAPADRRRRCDPTRQTGPDPKVRRP